MKQKNIFFLLAALVLGATFLFSTQLEEVRTYEPLRAPVSEESAKRTPSPEAPRKYTIPVSGDTVLSSMEALAASGNFSFSGKEHPGLGLFVEEIGELKNADGFYWTLFVDGVLSEKGASSARVAPESVIEWRYQKGL